VWRKSGQVELWSVATGDKVRDFEAKDVNLSVRFTLDGSAIVISTEGDVLSLYDSTSGELMNTFRDIGEANPLITFDPGCQRMHVWTERGLVLRYTKGIEVPFRGFYPRHRCNNGRDLASASQAPSGNGP
jgi:hypothetical protein